jgi:hypothetical protein
MNNLAMFVDDGYASNELRTEEVQAIDLCFVFDYNDEEEDDIE